MPREYEFTGLDEQGRRVYGLLIKGQDPGEDASVDQLNYQHLISWHTPEGQIEMRPVHKDSIGEYTGRLDSAQNRLFEGDLVQDGDDVGTVELSNGEYVLKIEGRADVPIRDKQDSEIIVVGTKAENPDLLSSPKIARV